MQIGDIPGDMNRGDLALAVAELAETRDEPVDDEAGMIGGLSGWHDIDVGPCLGNPHGQCEDLVDIAGFQGREIVETVREQIEGGQSEGGHATAPSFSAGAQVSQSLKPMGLDQR
jgi:hypothetical protein